MIWEKITAAIFWHNLLIALYCQTELSDEQMNGFTQVQSVRIHRCEQLIFVPKPSFR